MGIALEWAHLPTEEHLRTICHDGIPLPEVTHYLLVSGAGLVGSVRTSRIYAQLLLPFHIWLDYHAIRLSDVSLNDVMRFKHDLRNSNATRMRLLSKGENAADSTRAQVISATVRFLRWALGPTDTTPLRNWHEGLPPSQVAFSTLKSRDASVLDRLRGQRPRKRVRRHLTWDQLDQCRAWIMSVYAYDPKLQVRNRAILNFSGMELCDVGHSYHFGSMQSNGHSA